MSEWGKWKIVMASLIVSVSNHEAIRLCELIHKKHWDDFSSTNCICSRQRGQCFAWGTVCCFPNCSFSTCYETGVLFIMCNRFLGHLLPIAHYIVFCFAFVLTLNVSHGSETDNDQDKVFGKSWKQLRRTMVSPLREVLSQTHSFLQPVF